MSNPDYRVRLPLVLRGFAAAGRFFFAVLG